MGEDVSIGNFDDLSFMFFDGLRRFFKCGVSRELSIVSILRD
jgi:hypothetical protein